MATQPSPNTFDGTYRVPDLEGLRGRIKLVGPGGTRDLVIDDGHMTVTPEQGPPDCTITAFEPYDLPRLISGELNLVTSLLQGRIEAEGDPILLVKISGSMPDIGRQLPSKRQPQDRS
jgi:putative sterol carrier protein